MPQNKVTLGYRKRQEICYNFQGEEVSSDGGIVLLDRIENKHNILSNFSNQIKDPRRSTRVTHGIDKLIKQRVFLLALGYEDCNDSNELKHDPLISNLLDAQGGMASQPTLCRLENLADKKLTRKLLYWWVDQYISRIPAGTRELTIDVDSTDDKTYGAQQLSMFNGYYNHKAYHILVFHDASSGQIILPFLRAGNTHTAKGFGPIAKRLVERIRQTHPGMKITFRADSGFSGPKFYNQVESLEVEFCFGISSNAKLKQLISDEEKEVKTNYVEKEIKHQRIVGPFLYQAKSWDKPQKVWAKIESTGKGLNTRFITSNMEGKGKDLYFDFYVQRAEHSENRIKELKNMCFADRLSCHNFHANFLRLFFSSLSYEFMVYVKQAIAKTKDKKAKRWCVNSIRLYLLKIGAYVKDQKRKFTILFSKAYPRKELFHQIILII